MTLASFTTIDKAVVSAYSGQLSTHRLICHASGKYIIAPKGKIPSGFAKLNLNDIVAMTNKQFDHISQTDKKKLADVFGYMATRKVTKDFSGCFGVIKKILFIISNLFLGLIGKNPAEKAKALQQRLSQASQTAASTEADKASKVAPSTNPAAPAIPEPVPVLPTSPKLTPGSTPPAIEPLPARPVSPKSSAAPVQAPVPVVVPPPVPSYAIDISKITHSAKGENREDYKKRVYQDTKKICYLGYAKNNVYHSMDTQALIRNTEIYGEKTLPRLPEMKESEKFKTTFSVTDDDTFNVLLKQKLAGHNPVGIDMAHRTKPGGYTEEGHTAQEEELCRRSNLLQALKCQKYPLPPIGGIYCPDVTLFRKDVSSNYDFMDDPQQVSIVALSAVDLRDRKPAQKTHVYLKDDSVYRTEMLGKLYNMLRIMSSKGHDTLVLGAIGCGVFENPPTIVSGLLRYLFSRPEFIGRFKHVEFAILCPFGTVSENFEVFEKLCKDLNTPPSTTTPAATPATPAPAKLSASAPALIQPTAAKK